MDYSYQCTHNRKEMDIHGEIVCGACGLVLGSSIIGSKYSGTDVLVPLYAGSRTFNPEFAKKDRKHTTKTNWKTYNEIVRLEDTYGPGLITKREKERMNVESEFNRLAYECPEKAIAFKNLVVREKQSNEKVCIRKLSRLASDEVDCRTFNPSASKPKKTAKRSSFECLFEDLKSRDYTLIRHREEIFNILEQVSLPPGSAIGDEKAFLLAATAVATGRPATSLSQYGVAVSTIRSRIRYISKHINDQ